MGMFNIVSFLVIFIGITIYAVIRSKKVNKQDSEGYFLGGRSLLWPMVGMSIIMTNLSTEQLVGQNGQAYAIGMEVMAWEVTAAIAIVLCATVFLPKYLKYGINTISDFVEIRYDATTKLIISSLFIFTYVVSFMPVVLYSGSLIFNDLFDIEASLGVSTTTAVVLISTVIGIVGVVYLFTGGLSLVAHSDSLFGIGLLVGGMAITVLALSYLGDNSLIQGIDRLLTNNPEKLNAWGAVDSPVVPWPTLFFGLLFNNIYFWCTNQFIIQKSLAAKNLKEGQKGLMLVGIFKVSGLFFLVLPGVIAYHVLGDGLQMDLAYPALVSLVLPEWAKGIFSVIVFGAILSSFVGSLNATVTLFNYDFYKSIINKKATEKQMAKTGRIATLVVGILSIIVAPFIALFPQGLFNVIQEFNGLYNMPLLAIIVVGLFSKKTSALGAKVTLVAHVILYSLSKILIPDIHYLYVWSFLGTFDIFLVYIISKYKPTHLDFGYERYESKVDLTAWNHVKWVAAIVILFVIASYVVFSPLVLAK